MARLSSAHGSYSGLIFPLFIGAVSVAVLGAFV